MLSYTTEHPVTIYRIEIICRRYMATLEFFQSPHRQYGATQHRNHKLPIQSIGHHLRHCCLLQMMAHHCCMYRKHLTCLFSAPNSFNVLAIWLLLSLPPTCDYMPHPPNASARDKLLLGKKCLFSEFVQVMGILVKVMESHGKAICFKKMKRQKDKNLKK